MNKNFLLKRNKQTTRMGENRSGLQPVYDNMDNSSYREFYNHTQFLTGLVFYPIFCAIGLVGNTLVLVVLSHRKMASSTNTYLRALAVADIIKLLNDLLYFIVSILMREKPEAACRMMGHMYPFSHYIFNEAVCVSSWLTVCVGFDRFICVCLPTRAKSICTIERARIISTITFISMSIFTIPSWLRYEKTTAFNPDLNDTCYKIVLSNLGQNIKFMLAYSWIINLLRSVIPLCILIVLNACIIRSLQKERVQGKKMTAKNRITVMLIIVIIVFVVCVTPDAFMSTVFGYGYVEANFLVKGIRELTDFLLSLNSAVNFIIYCICSQTFRDCFKDIVLKHFPRAQTYIHLKRSNKEIVEYERDKDTST